MVASSTQVESCCRKEDDEQTFCEMRMDAQTWLGLMGHVSAEQVYKPKQHHDSTMDGKCDSTRVQKKGRAKQKVTEIEFSYFEFVS
jgi:hypothetical protein